MELTSAITHRDALYIGGEWVPPRGGGWLQVTSPVTEETFGRVPGATPSDVDDAVAAAREAFDRGRWPRMTVGDRADILMRMVDALEPHLTGLVDLQIDEIGSPRRFIERTTLGVRRQVAAEIAIAEAFHTQETRAGAPGDVVVVQEPVGVVGAVIPWNAPVALIMLKMLPAVLAGCTIVIKPAVESPLSAYVVAEALIEAGMPAGVVNIVAGDGTVGGRLVAHPDVDLVTFTGGTATGRRIAATCAELIRPVTLELGGKSAAIVLDDADLDRDLDALIAGSIPNNGQVCHATTRILVSENKHDETVARIVGRLARMKVGDPHDADTDFGPVVSAAQRGRVEARIAEAVAAGAHLAFGGGRPPIDRGWFVEPTVFSHVANDMAIAREEVFGPVMVVIPYRDVDHAIELANDSPYGLGGAVFAADPLRALEVARRMVTGTCVINSDSMPPGGGGPFGGRKQSGLGVEHGPEGFRAHFRVKSIGLPAGFRPA